MARLKELGFNKIQLNIAWGSRPGREALNLEGAIVRGVPWHTPSWCSTRRSVYMVVDTDAAPDPWMLEDIQIRCEQGGAKLGSALDVGQCLVTSVRPDLRSDFAAGLDELHQLRRRVLSFAFHLRESNLASVMRERLRLGLGVDDRHVAEMRDLLERDRENQESEEPMTSAITLLDVSPVEFLGTYFLPAEDQASRGHNSFTSP